MTHLIRLKLRLLRDTIKNNSQYQYNDYWLFDYLISLF